MTGDSLGDPRAWSRAYYQPFEVDGYVEGWRLEAVRKSGRTAYLNTWPNPGWSPRARCLEKPWEHFDVPVQGCGCGYRLVSDLGTLLDYWNLRRQQAFANSAPGVGIALVRAIAAGRAQAWDQSANLHSGNCLSVEYLRLAPHAPIYTTTAQHQQALRQRYRTAVVVLDDFAELREAQQA